MPHPKPHDIIPIGATCLWQRDKRKPAIKVTITGHSYLHGSFLNYEGTTEGRPSTEIYALYHDDLIPLN